MKYITRFNAARQLNIIERSGGNLLIEVEEVEIEKQKNRRFYVIFTMGGMRIRGGSPCLLNSYDYTSMTPHGVVDVGWAKTEISARQFFGKCVSRDCDY